MMRLRVERPDGPPVDTELTDGEVVIGRSAAAGVVLADLSVSRQHARLVATAGGWCIEALSPTNPTLLNDQPVGAKTPVRPGDVLRFGQTVVRVLDKAPAAPLAAPAAGPSDDRQAARLKTLNDIHRALAAPISLAELLHLILERCFDVLNPEEGVVMLSSPDGEFLPAASRKRDGRGDDKVFVSRRIVEEVAAKGKSALVLDAAVDERFSGSESLMMSGVQACSPRRFRTPRGPWA